MGDQALAAARSLEGWQWVALPFLLLGAAALGRALGWLTVRGLADLARRARVAWADEVVRRMDGPVSALWALGVLYFALPWLRLRAEAQGLPRSAVSIGFLLAVFWALLRGVDVVASSMLRTGWARRRPGANGLVPLAARAAKVALVAIALVAVLAQLGYPVASLLAGLGLGGLAVALAAQRVLADLFGSVAIAFDEPFRVGDLVKAGDVVGTVDLIGLRSTRLRTREGHLVTFPNGKLADLPVEVLRDRDGPAPEEPAG